MKIVPTKPITASVARVAGAGTLASSAVGQLPRFILTRQPKQQYSFYRSMVYVCQARSMAEAKRKAPEELRGADTAWGALRCERLTEGRVYFV